MALFLLPFQASCVFAYLFFLSLYLLISKLDYSLTR
nr:MAG TPA: hypothetical protein [Caudoviricetes sp.]